MKIKKILSTFLAAAMMMTTMSLTAFAAGGTIQPGVVTVDDEGSYINFELKNLDATESIEIWLYSGDEVLSTTELVKKNYLSNSALSAKVEMTQTSGSWDTTWNSKPVYNKVPDKAELWVDNVLVDSTDDIRMYNYDKPSDKREWKDIPGVALLQTAYVGTDRIMGEAKNVMASENFYIELYSGDTKIATTNLVDVTDSILDGNIEIITWNFTTSLWTDDYWNTVWEANNPSVLRVPNKIKYYADDEYIGENVVEMNGPDNLWPVVWGELDWVADVPVPQAVISDSTAERDFELTFAKNFKIPTEITDDQIEKYAEWFADFELKVNKDITFNADGSADGYLAGHYGDYGWISVPFNDVTIKANESFKIMEYAAKLLNKPGLKFTCAEVFSLVQDFSCGVFVNDEYLAKNPDFQIDLALNLYEPANETVPVPASDKFVFTVDYADEIKLDFRKVKGNENEYDIYVVPTAANQYIHRLSAVEGKFKLDVIEGEKIGYTLTPAEGVTLTEDIDNEEVYVFNFNGNSKPDDSGSEIYIGKVEFEGYGKFEFGLDSAYTETKANTATAADNIVQSYVPAAQITDANKQGEFDVENSKIVGGVELKEAEREIDVVIKFNNNITAGRLAEDVDMTVTLTGANGKVYEETIGTDDIDYTAKEAVVPFKVVVGEGTRYTVVIKGQGYRTARYTTLVQPLENKLTLNFWNNALENEDRTERKDYIEAGLDRSLRSGTFLAGDIAQDNIIDKYDLAAVVSYFGYDENTELSDGVYVDMTDYVKYDLNRDGRIDADDISYVLVSWGK